MTERLYASLAGEEAEALECCRQAVQVAAAKYQAGTVLSETEAGLDARTVYIALSRRTSPPPVADPSPATTPAASLPSPFVSAGSMDQTARSRATGQPPTIHPCPACQRDREFAKWWPGAVCVECYRTGKAQK